MNSDIFINECKGGGEVKQNKNPNTEREKHKK